MSPKKFLDKLTEVEEKIFFKEEKEEDLPKEGFNYIQPQYKEPTDKKTEKEDEASKNDGFNVSN